MKIPMKILVLALGFNLFALAFSAFAETVTTTTTTTNTTNAFLEPTLGDFQRAGNKPVIAWEKYQKYLYNQNHLPETTVQTQRINARGEEFRTVNREALFPNMNATFVVSPIANEETTVTTYREEYTQQ